MAYIKHSDLIISATKFDRHVDYNQQHGIPFVRLSEAPRVFKDLPKSKISEEPDKQDDRKNREQRIIDEAREKLDETIAEAKRKTLQRLLGFRLCD